MNYVGRFAPSPTGPLHFGSLVAALASYVDARANGGHWLVRIEDVDRARCSREHERTILRQLNDYGMQHDGDIVRQSERTAHFDAALSALVKQGLIYRCRCTRKLLATAVRNRDGEMIYPGTCRELALTSDKGIATSVRINTQGVANAAHVQFDDRTFGRIAQNVRNDVGDFILHRADGDYAYQLAVVVDDALQGVTHVVRGADLLSNTARQIVLQQALGYPTPSYLHVPLAVNDRGEKLSKQTLAPALPDEPAERMYTLKRAWAFLGQDDIGEIANPQAFLRRATATWHPERLQALVNRASASNL